MQADDLGNFHRFVEVTLDGVFDHSAQFFQSVSLGMDAVPQRGSRIAAVRLVIEYLKNDLAHEDPSRLITMLASLSAEV